MELKYYTESLQLMIGVILLSLIHSVSDALQMLLAVLSVVVDNFKGAIFF